MGEEPERYDKVGLVAFPFFSNIQYTPADLYKTFNNNYFAPVD